MSLSTSNSNLLAAAGATTTTSITNQTTTLVSYQDENSLLQQEINKLEDLLANARADRDEILIRYNALSERV